jgi:hypothetical protein
MTRLRLFLKNSVRVALNSLLFVGLCSLAACSSSTSPTYLKKNMAQAMQDICKKEYSIDVKATLVGNTFWVYVPLENIVEVKQTAKKSSDDYTIESLGGVPDQRTLKFDYSIQRQPQERDKEYKYNKEAAQKINNAWKVLRRIIFSLDRSKRDEPQFYCFIYADIRNGDEVSEIFYYLDLKKVSYEYISMNEYQHRTIQDSLRNPAAVGDTEGRHIYYRDITMPEFIVAQVLHRLRLKFQKPELEEKSADVDKELAKIISNVIMIYNFRDFDYVEMNNLVTKNKILLNRQALWKKANEQ